ncbi:MAG: SEC-C metal-binding domain-containing protein, partial [Armatimonadota bacterium]
LYEYIHLRAYAQTDPFIAYQQEAYNFFESLKQSMAEDVTRLLFVAEVAVEQRERATNIQKSRGGQVGAEEEGARKPVTVGKKPGRNAPCPCGSGKKYKKCCMVGEAQPSSSGDGDGDGSGDESSDASRKKKRRRKR